MSEEAASQTSFQIKVTRPLSTCRGRASRVYRKASVKDTSLHRQPETPRTPTPFRGGEYPWLAPGGCATPTRRKAQEHAEARETPYPYAPPRLAISLSGAASPAPSHLPPHTRPRMAGGWRRETGKDLAETWTKATPSLRQPPDKRLSTAPSGPAKWYPRHMSRYRLKG